MDAGYCQSSGKPEVAREIGGHAWSANVSQDCPSPPRVVNDPVSASLVLQRQTVTQQARRQLPRRSRRWRSPAAP